MALHLVHHWRTVRDDGYWLYQECLGCKQRRVQAKNSLKGQPPNPVWMQGGKLPTPIGEKGAE
ncbi:MAG TPA: hypothetical protein VMV18_12180 [bacterium]|nr:hypothetical protein [bacterium]